MDISKQQIHLGGYMFDPATTAEEIVTSLGGANTAIASILGAAILITVALVVYRHFKGGINRT